MDFEWEIGEAEGAFFDVFPVWPFKLFRRAVQDLQGLPFGCLGLPFWAILVPLGSQNGALGPTLASLGSPFGSFGIPCRHFGCLSSLWPHVGVPLTTLWPSSAFFSS